MDKRSKITPKYKAYNLSNFQNIPMFKSQPKSIIDAINIVGRVLPFKVNNYIIDELIDWSNIPDDPLYTLVFPRRLMLTDKHYAAVEKLIKKKASETEINFTINEIRKELNPHPSGQHDNVPLLNGKPVSGVQHKYAETLLFFPARGQSCHAYCTFCFRWPQFTKMEGEKFSRSRVDRILEYIRINPSITDILITGGDAMIMNSTVLGIYLNAIIDAKIPHLQNIRIGTKALSYWPYKFIDEPDSDHILRLFEKVNKSGLHLAFMAHLNHPRELKTDAVRKAIIRIRNTGAIIRSQGPILRHINDRPELWVEMWKTQIKLGIIPYYMFVARDTGAHHFFSLPLVKTHKIFYKAYRNISGLGRSIRGPVMSTNPGKIQILGSAKFNSKKVIELIMLQARNKDMVGKPFFAKYNKKATWIDELEPAGGKSKFPYE